MQRSSEFNETTIFLLDAKKNIYAHSILLYILQKNNFMTSSNLKDDNTENNVEGDDDDYEPDDENFFDGHYDGDQDGPYSQNVAEHLVDQLGQDVEYG